MTSFKLAYLNLTRRKIPSIIAIISIAISVACSGILYRLNYAAQNRFSTLGKGGDAIVGAKAGGIDIMLGALNGEGEYPGFLPYKLFETLRSQINVKFEDGAQAQPTYIESIIPFLYFGKLKNFRAVGTDETFFHRPNVTDSIDFAQGNWSTAVNDLAVGSEVARKENLKVGDVVQVQSWVGESSTQLQSAQFKVAGVMKKTGTTWDRMVFANLSAAQGMLASVNLGDRSIWGPEVLNYFLVYLKPNGFSDLSSLVNKRTVGQAVLVSEQKSRLKDLSGVGEKIGFFVTVLILVLSGLAVSAMLITRFDAMSLQLAVLRAVGYRKSEIAKWLLWEGFLIGLAACVLGLLIDLTGFPIMRSLLSDALPPADLVPVSILVSLPIWIMALTATIASVFFPLYRVYKQDVHFSLRG